MEIQSTGLMVQLLKDQMLQTKRIIQDKELTICLAFRRAKSGFKFETVDKFEEYLDVQSDNAISYSQNNDGHFPFESKQGIVIREGTWRNPARIAQLIQLIYVDNTCKLFYGFTKEHSNSFYRISTNLTTKKHASPFLPYITDKVDTSPNEDIIDNKNFSISSIRIFYLMYTFVSLNSTNTHPLMKQD